MNFLSNFQLILIYLKLVFLTTQTGSLLLPKVVRLDDMCGADQVGEVLVQNLEDRLDLVPSGGASHVNDHSEAVAANIIIGNDDQVLEESTIVVRLRLVPSPRRGERYNGASLSIPASGQDGQLILQLAHDIHTAQYGSIIWKTTG